MNGRIMAGMLLVLLAVGLTRAQEPARVVTGVIDDSNPLTEVAFDVPENYTVTLTLTSTDPAADLDPYLYLVDPESTIVAENDDLERGNTNSQIAYPLADAGNYRVIATRYGAVEGNTSGSFDLTITVQPPVAVEEVPYPTSEAELVADGFPVIEVRPEAEWTIIAYYGGDTNLENGVLNDMREFERAGGSNERVRVVMMLDRNIENFVTDPDWHSNRLYEIAPDATDSPLPGSPAITDLGVARISADGAFFAQYMAWAVRHFPAKRYAVAFASHGAAWEGLIQDDTPNPEDAPTTNRDKLSLTELSRALEIGTQMAGVEKFDLLINDACLMSSIEYFDVMDGFFDVSIASPEVVIDPALNMTLFTQLLNDDPAGDLTDYLRQLVDYYIDTDIRVFNTPDLANLTHTVTDLTAFPAVVDAVENFARVFNRDPRSYATLLGQVRSDAGTYVYSSFLGSQTKVDLGTLMAGVVRIVRNPELRNAALSVLDALEEVKLYARNGGNVALDTASYYNIYFPAEASFFHQGDYVGTSPLIEWTRMLRNYYNALNPSLAQITGDTTQDFHPPVAPKVSITSVYPLEGDAASINSPVIMQTQIAGRNLAGVQTAIDQLQPDGTYIRLATESVLFDQVNEDGTISRVNVWSPGVDSREVLWDATLPLLYDTDPATGSFELITFTESVAYMDAYYYAPGSQTPNDVTIIFDVVDKFTSGTGSVQRVISRSPNSETAADIDVPVGSIVYPFRSQVTADGVVVLQVSPRTLVWQEGYGLHYQWSPAPNGSYQYGVLATAFGGATGFANADVLIDNSTASLDTRGDTAPFSGFTLVRPANWQRMAYSYGSLEPLTVELYRTSSDDDPTNAADDGISDYSVYVISDLDNGGEPIPNDLNTIVDLLAALGGFTITSDLATTTFLDQPAVEFGYTYESEKGTVRGLATTIWRDIQNGFGYTFSAESLDPATDLNALAATLRGSVQLFDTGAVLSARDPLWRTEFLDFGQVLLPVNWQGVEDIPGRYSENGNPAATTFFQWFNEERPVGLTLQGFFDGAIAPQLASVQIIGQRAYSNASPWDVLLYTGTRDGAPVQGRLYSGDRDGILNVLWIETRTDADAATRLATLLEIIVDTVFVY